MGAGAARNGRAAFGGVGQGRPTINRRGLMRIFAALASAAFASVTANAEAPKTVAAAVVR